MRPFIIIFFIFLSGQLLGQTKRCFCEKDTLMNLAISDYCKPTLLKNNSRLYWQYTCDRIWLTLENAHKQKFTIDEIEPNLFGYVYRLGFQLIKEFDSFLLFRSGCPANGPCVYTLINKMNGKKVKQFKQLICIDTDLKEQKYQFDFVVYFNDDYNKLNVYYINSRKLLSIPFDASKNDLVTRIPEFQFDKMHLHENVLALDYHTMEKEKRTLKINLLNKTYSR